MYYIYFYSQYPQINEPEYVAEARKRILLSGCESGSISINKAKTALWLLLWKGLAPHEKVKTNIFVRFGGIKEEELFNNFKRTSKFNSFFPLLE